MATLNRFARNRNQPDETQNTSSPNQKSLPKTLSRPGSNDFFEGIGRLGPVNRNPPAPRIEAKKEQIIQNPLTMNKSMGMVTNVFMSSTTKFMKGQQTPSSKEIGNLPAPVTSQASPTAVGKLARNNNRSAISQYVQEPVEEPGRKIERKHGQVQRELKFTEKKQQSVEKPVPVQNSQKKPYGRTPVPLKQQIVTQPQQTQNVVEPVVAPKPNPYQPYRRPAQQSNSSQNQTSNTKSQIKEPVRPRPASYKIQQENDQKVIVAQTPKQPQPVTIQPPGPKPRTNLYAAKQQSNEPQEQTSQQSLSSSKPKPYNSGYRSSTNTQSKDVNQQTVDSFNSKSKASYYNPYKKNTPETLSSTVQSIEPGKPKPTPYQPYRRPQTAKVNQQPEKTIQEPVKEVQKPKPRLGGYSYASNKVQQTEKETNDKSVISNQASSVNASPYKPYRRNQQISDVKPKQQIKQAQIEVKTIGKATPSRSFVNRKNQTISPVVSQTPSQIQNKVNQQSNNDPSPINLKKSYTSLLIVARILKNKLINSFSQLRNNSCSAKLHLNEANLLADLACSIFKTKIYNLKVLAFQNLKKRCWQKLLNQSKNEPKKEHDGYRKAPCIVLQMLFKTKLKQSFGRMQLRADSKIKATKIVILQQTIFAKEKDFLKRGFSSVFDWAKRKASLVDGIIKISKNYLKNQLFLSFARIQRQEKTQNSQVPAQSSTSKKPIRSQPFQSMIETTPKKNLAQDKQKISKIVDSNSTINREIAGLQSKMKKVQKQKDTQRQGLQRKIDDLRQNNEQAHQQIQIKRQKLGVIKQQIDEMRMKKSITPTTIEQRSNQQLTFLTQFYIDYFKNNNEAFSSEQLINKHGLQQQDHNTMLKQWELIEANVQLKREIAAFQQTDVRQYKARSTLTQQQKVLSRLINSYIRQQYFWEWIHISSQL